MSVLIKSVSINVLQNVIFLILGSILSVPVYLYGQKLSQRLERWRFRTGCCILLGAVLGLLLPFKVYGILPIALAAVAAGLTAAAIPLILSNVLFNLLVPFTDPTFSLQSGMHTVALAFLAAIIGGGLMTASHKASMNLFKSKVLMPYREEKVRWSKLPSLLQENLLNCALFLVAGAIINVVFEEYILLPAIQYIYTNPKVSFIPVYFAGLNVVNPFFLQAMNIVYLLLDLSILLGLCSILKRKGILLYLGYYIAIFAALGVTAFFKIGL